MKASDSLLLLSNYCRDMGWRLKGFNENSLVICNREVKELSSCSLLHVINSIAVPNKETFEFALKLSGKELIVRRVGKLVFTCVSGTTYASLGSTTMESLISLMIRWVGIDN